MDVDRSIDVRAECQSFRRIGLLLARFRQDANISDPRLTALESMINSMSRIAASGVSATGASIDRLESAHWRVTSLATECRDSARCEMIRRDVNAELCEVVQRLRGSSSRISSEPLEMTSLAS